MNIIKYTLGLSIGFIILIGFEGLITLGSAFNFGSYGIIGWIVQTLLIIIITCLSILITKNLIENE